MDIWHVNIDTNLKISSINICNIYGRRPVQDMFLVIFRTDR